MRGLIIFRLGKQTVYHALQKSSDECTPGMIATLEQDIKQCQNHLSTLKTNEKRAKSELAELHARPLLSELHHDIGQLKEDQEGLLAGLADLSGSEAVAISPEGKEAVEKEWKYLQRHANVRRRICCDLWRRCSEVLPENMTREELKVNESYCD